MKQKMDKWEATLPLHFSVMTTANRSVNRTPKGCALGLPRSSCWLFNTVFLL